jgi:Protein of unknown function (DUF4232)
MTDRGEPFEERLVAELRSYLSRNAPSGDAVATAASVIAVKPRSGVMSAVAGVATIAVVIIVMLGIALVRPPSPASSPGASGSAPASTSSQLPAPATVLARIPLAHVTTAVVAGDSLWAIIDVDPAARLVRVNLQTLATTFVADPVDFFLERADDGSLWTSRAKVQGGQIVETHLAEVDVQTGAVRPVRLPALPPGTRAIALAPGLGSIWISIEPAGLPIDPTLAALWRVDPETGQLTWSRHVDMGTISVACGQVWGDAIGNSGWALKELDPATSTVTDHPGAGPVDERADGCWRWVDSGIERVWPAPPSVTATSEAPDVFFDGQDFWRWSGNHLQGWDPTTGRSAGTVWTLPDALPPSNAQGVALQPLVAGGADSVWLITTNELVEVSVARLPSSTLPSATSPATSPSALSIGPCRTSDLAISVTNTGAAAGNVGGYLLFENTTAVACTLQGAPTLTAKTLAGAATRARVAVVVGTPFPSLTQPPLVILEPDDKAFAAYGGSDNSGSDSATCPPPYHTFQVTPPGNTIGAALPAFNSWLGQDQPSCVGIDVTVIAPASEVEQYTDLSSLRP